MTQRFILDENVFICAQLETNVNGQPDSTCLELLQQILEICHPMVFDSVLFDKIQSQLNRPAHQRQGFGAALLRTLSQAGARPGKLDITEEPPPFPEEADIPQGSQDDKFIVRLAIASGATLVTLPTALYSTTWPPAASRHATVLAFFHLRAPSRRSNPYRPGKTRPMTSRASSSGMLLATAQGAVSAMMASRLPDSVCFLYWSSYSMPRARPTSVR